MMAAAKADMNVTIISMNLDILEQQRGHMHHAVDQYVDTMIDAGKQWVTRGERNQSTFLEIHKIISKTIAFLSMQYDEIKSHDLLVRQAAPTVCPRWLYQLLH